MIIQAKVAEGENSYHIRKSARRCTIGNELVLALLFPREDRQSFQTTVRCITVRARGRTTRDDPTIVPSRTIEWEVVDPAGIRARTDTRFQADGVPLSAFWLISQDCSSDADEPNAKLPNPFYPYGSNSLRGFVSWVVALVTKLTLITITMVTYTVLSDTSVDAVIQIVGLVVSIYIPYKIIQKMIKDGLPEKPKLQAPRIRRRSLVFGMFRISTYHKLEWHGSTRRSLAIGDRMRHVAFWQQIYFNLWEPFMERLNVGLDRVRELLGRRSTSSQV